MFSVTMDLLQGGDIRVSRPTPQPGGPSAVFVWPFTWNQPSKVRPNQGPKSQPISIPGSLRPRPHYTVFKRNDTVLFRIRLPPSLQWSENGSFRKRSPEWNDLKTVLFENAVFLVRTVKTILSENDDVTTTTPPGCRPLNREYTR